MYHGIIIKFAEALQNDVTTHYNLVQHSVSTSRDSGLAGCIQPGVATCTGSYYPGKGIAPHGNILCHTFQARNDHVMHGEFTNVANECIIVVLWYSGTLVPQPSDSDTELTLRNAHAGEGLTLGSSPSSFVKIPGVVRVRPL